MPRAEVEVYTQQQQRNDARLYPFVLLTDAELRAIRRWLQDYEWASQAWSATPSDRETESSDS
jgi:hypothetical protein